VEALRTIAAALVQSYQPVAHRAAGTASGLLGLAGEGRGAA
jgi:hypothetical protein